MLPGPPVKAASRAARDRRPSNEARPHQGIDNIPDIVAGRIPPREPQPAEQGHLVAWPVLAGLAHDYRLAA